MITKEKKRKRKVSNKLAVINVIKPKKNNKIKKENKKKRH
jgi:hypothetical protein